jgi:hypothetical protein
LSLCAVVAITPTIPEVFGQTYSTGAVNTYHTCGLSPDLPNRIEAAKRFRDWYNLAGFPNITRWENDDVFIDEQVAAIRVIYAPVDSKLAMKPVVYLGANGRPVAIPRQLNPREEAPIKPRPQPGPASPR